MCLLDIIFKFKTIRGYSYKLNLPDGYKIETANQYIVKKIDTGEVYIVDNKNIIKYIISKTWPKDSLGKHVKTSFVFKWITITRKVSFNKNSLFPIVDDSIFWKITVCVGAISWSITSTIFSAAKIFKIKKYIKELGGLRIAAELLLKATSTKVKLRVGGMELKKLGIMLGDR